MAGRGRGKPTMSFTTEQFGFVKGELLPSSVLQPPPSYPPLEHKPLSITLTTEMGYLVELKRDFSEYMRESSNNVLPIVLKKDIERYSDRYQDTTMDKSNEFKCDWSRMPAELRSSRKRKVQRTVKPSKKQKVVDVETKLAELEKKESTQQDGVEEEDKEEEEDAEEEMDENVENNGKIDEEMDDGTDYANSYFDNGEGYDDEEENLDDGPVYWYVSESCLLIITRLGVFFRDFFWDLIIEK